MANSAVERWVSACRQARARGHNAASSGTPVRATHSPTAQMRASVTVCSVSCTTMPRCSEARTLLSRTPIVALVTTTLAVVLLDRGVAGGGLDLVEAGEMARDGLAWEHLELMRRMWKGKLVLKGVLSPADVRDTFDVMGALEGLSGELACARITDDEVRLTIPTGDKAPALKPGDCIVAVDPQEARRLVRGDRDVE